MNEKAFHERYSKLNPAQKKAVDTIDGPVLVVAGPGSGKTEILSLRIANILRQTDIYPGNILAITFTDAAAVNIRKRLAEIIGADAYRVAIYTFHSFALSVSERFPEYFYGGAIFSAADELVQAEVLEAIFVNMSYDNPLSSSHPEQGFVYLGGARSAISSIKKAGLTPVEFRAIVEHNHLAAAQITPKIDQVFSQTISKKIIPVVENLRDELKNFTSPTPFPVAHFDPLAEVLARSLTQVLAVVEETGKTAPLSKWKNDHTYKEGNDRRLKLVKYHDKMVALADVYERYSQEMHERGYVDFDDMLLDCISAIQDYPTLRAELQEQFLYLLVDEFQDTNDAQMRLLNLLTEHEIHEGKPNVMAVGDDDQAIYRFQGAEISNILHFTEEYPGTEVITMTKNYRSTQDVLDLARHVIVQGDERLENLLPEIRKDLQAANITVEAGDIKSYIYPTRVHEYQGVVELIKARLAAGIPPEEIVVIARRHADLVALVPFLHQALIPVSYDRQDNILIEPHIREIIQMTRFVDSLARQGRSEADHLLPEILSYPFWGLNRSTVWEISLQAEAGESRLWLEVMIDSGDEKLRQIAHFFIDLAIRAQHEPVEYILESLVGAHMPLTPDETVADEIDEPLPAAGFVSPYKEYHFSHHQYEENREEYLRFLSGLKSFVEILRQYRQGQIVKVDDLVRFVDLHEQNNIPLNDANPFTNAPTAVSLMTVHKAKGLEFDTVIILSAQQEIWASGGRHTLLPFPINLPIAPAGDTLDDQLRLLYVALTRAKRHLYLTAYERDERGKESLPLEFLTGYEKVNPESRQTEVDTVTLLEPLVPDYHKPPFIANEKSLLAHLVKEYQLSVTHLNNYLDVTAGGPRLFLEQNLLRFPQPKSKNGIFGTVMHGVLERVHIVLKKDGHVPSLETVLEFLAEALSRTRLSQFDRDHLHERGVDALTALYKEKKDGFSPEHLVEYNFKQEGAAVGEAHLTGKIDRLVKVNSNEMLVCDYKTGSAETQWIDSSVKLWKYRNQLYFYKLLVENSRQFGNTFKVKRGLLEFVEPLDGHIIDLSLDLEPEYAERLVGLVRVVYNKIKALDFPDVTDYQSTVRGIESFCDDLLAGRV